MWKWWNRKREPVNRDLASLGAEMADRITNGLRRWRSEVLEPCVNLMCDAFDERLVRILPNDRVSIRQHANMEQIAMLDKWRDAVRANSDEPFGYFPNEAIIVIGVLGLGDNIRQLIAAMFADAERDLIEHTSVALSEILAE